MQESGSRGRSRRRSPPIPGRSDPGIRNAVERYRIVESKHLKAARVGMITRTRNRKSDSTARQSGRARRNV